MNEDNKTKHNDALLMNTSRKEEDIDLFDLIAQLWQGKLTIIIAAVITIALGFTYLSVVKEKWTSKATVTLPAAGQVANYNAALAVVYADSPQDKPSITSLQGQLFGRFTASMSALSNALNNIEQPLKLTISPVGNGSDAVSIAFTSESAAAAREQLKKYIQQVNDDVVEDYGVDIKRNLSVKTRELTNTMDTLKQVAIDKKAHRLDVIKQALKIAEASTVNKLQVNQAEFLSDDTLYLLGSDALNAMVENETSRPLEYTGAYYEAQRALLALTHLKVEVENLQSYRYIAEPDLPLKRDSPKKGLIILFSAILGGFIGIVIVLSRNALRSRKKRYL